MSNLIILPARRPRLSPKLLQALDLIVFRGLTVIEASQQVGFSRPGLHKALTRPAVKAEVERLKLEAAVNLDQMLLEARIAALEVARELMATSKSDSIKARIAKILLNASRQSQPPVAAKEAYHAGPALYNFTRPSRLKP